MPAVPKKVNPLRRRSVALIDATGEVFFEEPGILPIYSIAKTMIASAIMQSELDIQAPVRNWVEPKWLPDADGITIAHLLHHSAGLPDYSMTPAYAQAIERREAPWSDERYADETLHQPRLFEPGTGFSYSNPGYWLLKTILERVHQQTWPDILSKLITSPLGLHDTHVVYGQFAEDLPDYPAGWVWHGVILSNAKDIARFMASDLITPLLTSRQKVSGEWPPWIDPHYGYGLMTEPGVMYGHNGGGPGYTAAAYHFEESGITGCVLLASEEDNGALKALTALVEK